LGAPLPEREVGVRRRPRQRVKLRRELLDERDRAARALGAIAILMSVCAIGAIVVLARDGEVQRDLDDCRPEACAGEQGLKGRGTQRLQGCGALNGSRGSRGLRKPGPAAG